MLALAALMAYHGADDMDLWVEVDGDVVRARRLYTMRVRTRRVGEIEEVRTLEFAARGVAAQTVEWFVGRVRGFEMRFPGGRRGVGVFRPEMTNVWELMATSYSAMGREGKLPPEIEAFEGRPWLQRMTWAGRSPHPEGASAAQE